ncbi:MAG: outer membrane protein assembly factor [Chitinispirillaceae bacterium]
MIKQLAAVLILLIAAAQCRAQREKWYAGNITFRGNQAFERSELLSRMLLRPPDFFERTEYSFSRLTGDMRRLESFYATRGFFNVAVRISDVSRDTSVHLVNVELRIYEGVQTVVDTLVFRNNRVFTDSALSEFLPLEKNEPLDSLLYAQSGAVIRDSLASRGYLLAEIKDTVRFSENGDSAAVIFEVEEGPLVLSGTVDILGAQTVHPRVVRRELVLDSGSVLTSFEISRSVRRLYSTGLFDYVRIEPLDTANVPAAKDTVIVPVAIRLQLTDFFRLTAGGGYSTDEGVYATGEISYGNLFELGHRISVSGRLSYDLFGAQVIYSYPWFLQAPLFADLMLYMERRDEEEFAGLFRGGLFSLSGNFNALTAYRGWVRVENTAWIEGARPGPRFPERLRNNVALFGLGISRDTRDDVLNPGGGFFGFAEAEFAGPGISWSDKFFRTKADFRWYISLPSRRFRFLSAFFAGYVRGFGEAGAAVSPQELFRVGDGVRPVRGYSDDAVADMGERGRLAFIITPLEMTFPIYTPLDGAVFMDGGHIWSSLDNFNFGDVQWSVGAGLRLTLPIGVVRFDYGVKLDGDSDLDGRFHLGVGTAF